MKKLEKANHYELLIDNKKVVDCEFINANKAKKYFSVFDLPATIIEEFYLIDSDFMRKESFKLSLDTTINEDRLKIEKMITDIFFSIVKIIKFEDTYEQIKKIAFKNLNLAKLVLIEAKLLATSESDIIKFDWENEKQVKALAAVMNVLINAYYQTHEHIKMLYNRKIIVANQDKMLEPYRSGK